MKLIKNLTLGVLLTAVSLNANAAWTETKVKTIQMAEGGTSVYVYLETPVAFDTCNHDTYGQQARGLIIGQANGNFDQMYSALLAAKHADSSLSVLSSSGDCVSDYWVVKPLVRFW